MQIKTIHIKTKHLSLDELILHYKISSQSKLTRLARQFAQIQVICLVSTHTAAYLHLSC